MSEETQDTATWRECESGEQSPKAFSQRMEAVFNTQDVYAPIGGDVHTTISDIKKRINKMCRKVHPDKLKENYTEKAKEEFLLLIDIKKLLLNKEPKRLYDSERKP